MVTVIGAGLAGSEAAWQLAQRGIDVTLYEMKPNKYTPAHKSQNFAELVCSNSLRSDRLENAVGLLKEELRILESELIKVADSVSVPAGQALAVDREKFSEKITEMVENNEYIEVIREEMKEIPKDKIVIIATGPLTSNEMYEQILKITGEENLFFYDAAAPIIEKESINMDIAFLGNRYEQEREKDEDIEVWKERIKSQDDSYINLPMNKEEYEIFYNELVKAEVVKLHEFEKREIFEGCMPIEIMAKRGLDTLRFGPLKPVGFTDLRTGKRPYAIVQLRQDNSEGTLYNMVGFQTNLKYGEQKRVFSLIPGLSKANFVKYGVMHRNTFIDSTKLLDNTYHMKKNINLFFAGQITGVEGYVESISSGFVAAINACILYNIYKEEKKEDIEEKYEENKIIYPDETVIGALSKYISTKNEKFQPMNANFGILPQLDEKIKDKKEKNTQIAQKSLDKVKKCCNGQIGVL